MKKLISTLCCIAVAASVTSIPVFADKPEPVDVDPVLYKKLVATDWICDHNQDGTVTEEELRTSDRVILDMDGVKDLSWFKYLDSCELLCLTGGDITDYSAVKDLPKLTDLQLHSVPITDISFVKDMHLENCTLGDMPQITLEQRLAVATWDENVTIEEGFQKRFGISPRNIIGDELKCSMTVDDISIARVVNGFSHTSGSRGSFYGVKPGKTKFHIFTPDDVEVVSGTITVKATKPYDPPLGDGEFTGTRSISDYYDTTTVALQNGTLYRFDGSQVIVCEENVKAFDNGYRIPPNRVYKYFDVVAKTDGTFLLNGKVIPDIDCKDIQNECVITKQNELYGIYPDGKELVLLKIADDFKEFSFTADAFYINLDGEVIGYYVGYDQDEKPYVKTFPTGIMNPVSMHYNLFVDEDHVLWHPWVKYGDMTNSKVAENVVEVGYYPTGEYYLYEYLYKTEDGSYHMVYKDETMEPVPENPAKYGFLKNGNLYIYQYKDEAQDISGYIDWFLTPDHTLTMNNNGEHTAVTNVALVIDSEYDKELNQGYVYFYRTDGSMWRYCFETKKYQEVLPNGAAPEILKGDVNQDGKLDVTDVVLLQKWLHGISDKKLTNSGAGDMTGDGVLDVFDLSLLKREVLKK